MKKVTFGIAVAIALAAAALLLLRPRAPRPGTATLPDGKQIIVQAVTYGTNHAFVHGSEVVGKIQKYLPFTRGLLPPLLAMTTTTSEEFLIVWYSLYDPATEKYLSVPVDTFSVIDEHGCAFPVNQWGGNQGTPTFSASSAYVRVFPRRQKTFTGRMKLFNYPPVDLRIQNPLPPIIKEWTPEPLPVTHNTNNLAVTLKGVKVDKASGYAYTDFKIVEDGVARDEWYSPAVNFRDAAGNSHYRALCPHERTWKVEVDLYKTAKAPFPESAIWRIPNVTVPKSGEFHQFTNETRIGGVSLNPIALCGAGSFVFSNNVCVSAAPWKEGQAETSSTRSYGLRDVRLDFSSKHPSLIIRVNGWRTSSELLIRRQSPEGARGPYQFQFRGSAGDMCRFELNKPLVGERVHLEFIPQQPVRVEFLIQPPQP